MFAVHGCQLPPPPTFTPGLAWPRRYLMMGKRMVVPPQEPEDPEYLDSPPLIIRCSATPLGQFAGGATLTGQNLDRIRPAGALLQNGILTPRQFGGGWTIAAGALQNPLDIGFFAVQPSAASEDIHLTLTLVAGFAQAVQGAATVRLTSIELTLDVDDGPQRQGQPAPALLDAYGKVVLGTTAFAELAGEDLHRTRLVLRRARPADLPATLRVEISADDDARARLCLTNRAQPHNGEQSGSHVTIANNAIHAQDGTTFYLKGLRSTGDFQARIQASIDGEGENGLGDYLSTQVDPVIRARWQYAWVYPPFDGAQLAASRQYGDAPDDRNIDLTASQLVIDVAGYPQDTAVTVTVHRCNDAQTQVANLQNLTIDAQGRVVNQGAARPTFSMTARDGLIWSPHDAPYFFFKVAIQGPDAAAETSHDHQNHAGDCLRLKYLHSMLIDPTANDIQTAACRNEVLNWIQGVPQDEEDAAEAVLGNHRFLRPDYDGGADGVQHWLAPTINTFSHFQFSHGGYWGNADAPAANNFYTFIAFGHQRQYNFLALRQHVLANNNHRDLPRHLVFLAACHSAWDPRLAQWLIGNRPHCYVIAFRRTVTRPEIQEMAGRFYYRWLVDEGADPTRIPASFAAVAPDYDAIEPRLFDRGSDFAAFLPLA